jgi:hypothetical protein
VIVHLVDGTYEIFRQYYAPRPGLRAKFEREADPDGELSPQERARRPIN